MLGEEWTTSRQNDDGGSVDKMNDAIELELKDTRADSSIKDTVLFFCHKHRPLAKKCSCANASSIQDALCR